jgi:hypothetical protein
VEASRNAALRTLVCACAAGALLLCASGSSATAATSIGQLDPGTPTGSCLGVSSWVQSTEAGPPSYIVPAGRWVIVSWSHRANSASGRELGVRVWRTTATPGSYTLVGAGALRTLTPGGINTLYERITAFGGDILGLRVGNPPATILDLGGGASCASTAGAGDSIRYGIAASEPPSGSTSPLPALLPVNRLNVTARLEADADSDGFGDETQDTCPGTAGSASGCAPAAPGPGKDTSPPAAKLDARRDSIRDGRVAVWVTATEAATVTATGTLGIASHASTHRLRTATARVVARKRERMLLRLSKKTRRAARRALRRGKRLHVRVSVTLRDAAGNTGTAKRSVRLKR